MRMIKMTDLVMVAFILILSLVCLLPLMLVLMVSFTPESLVVAKGYNLFPQELSLHAYEMVFRQSAGLLSAYRVSSIVTVLGTILSLLITACAAYTLANRRVRLRRHLAMFFFFTTMFNGGIVPWYIINIELGLHNNFAALIVPTLLFNCFNMFLLRNYMMSIPDSLLESALIDGASDFYIALRIYFPLSKPALAAVSLFIAIAYWNDWWNAIMLIDDRALYPLQYFLFDIQSQIQMLRDLEAVIGVAGKKLPNETFKMATVILTIGPIILLYPFLQRYFVKGLLIGSVKG